MIVTIIVHIEKLLKIVLSLLLVDKKLGTTSINTAIKKIAAIISFIICKKN